MMKLKLKDRYAAALLARGERLVKRNFKHDVYSRKAGGHYYLGKAGSVRIGNTVQSSVPLHDNAKKLLLNDGENREH